MMSSGYIEQFSSDSAAARLDARVKLVLVFCILVLVFIGVSIAKIGPEDNRHPGD